MKISEIADRLEDIRGEFGDVEGYVPDQLEPTWRCLISSVEFDPDSQSVVVTVE